MNYNSGKFKLNIPLLSGQTNVTLKSVYHVASVVCPFDGCYAFSDIVNTGKCVHSGRIMKKFHLENIYFKIQPILNISTNS